MNTDLKPRPVLPFLAGARRSLQMFTHSVSICCDKSSCFLKVTQYKIAALPSLLLYLPIALFLKLDVDHVSYEFGNSESGGHANRDGNDNPNGGSKPSYQGKDAIRFFACFPIDVEFGLGIDVVGHMIAHFSPHSRQTV